MSGNRCDRVTQVGPYVLGTLHPRDAAEVEAHLHGCPDCESERAELEPVALALVNAGPVRTDLDDTPDVPSDRVERGLLARVAAETRRRRRVRSSRIAVAAAAIVTLAGGTAVAVAARRGDREDGPSFVIEATGSAKGKVTGSVRVWEKPWGSYALVSATGLPAGEMFRLWFEEQGGVRVPMGSFVGTGKQPINCVGVAATQLRKAVAVGASDKGGADVFRAQLAFAPAGSDGDNDRRPT